MQQAHQTHPARNTQNPLSHLSKKQDITNIEKLHTKFPKVTAFPSIGFPIQEHIKDFPF
jgi:hypothetical protein